MLHILAAKYISNYQISVLFDDGECVVCDFENFIFGDSRKAFFDLRTLKNFSNFCVEAGTLVWPNGVDLAPEFVKTLRIDKPRCVAEPPISYQ